MKSLKVDPVSLRVWAQELRGKVAGVYLLYDGDELVYVGHSWNCMLGVAEQTRKERPKHFTHWNFIPLSSEDDRRAFQRELVREYSPKYNKT
jgi:hypothetical protein